MSKTRRSRSEIFSGAPSLALWPMVSDTVLAEDQRELFHKRCQAVTMYAEGYPGDQIQEMTGIARTKLPHLASRCLEVAFDGKIMGFRALIPHIHSKQYHRLAEVKHKYPEAQGGLSGVFVQILKRFPEVERKLVQYIKKHNSPDLNVHEKKIRAKNLHALFIKSLGQIGIEAPQWPFNTKHRGLRTIYKYLNKVLNESFQRSVTTREEQVAIAHLAVGTGYGRLLKFEEPYDVVQLDAYSINAFFTAEFQTPEGTTVDVQLERLWLIAMIELVSGAILSQSVVYRSEVGADDVISVIKKAVNSPVSVPLTIPGLEYPENGGLPAEVIPECRGAIWGSIMLDGALAHLSQAIHSRARKTLGFAINWGPVAHFERRPDIERYFGTISKDIFMRMPSTTGSNPGKGRAKNAEQKAVVHKIRADEMEQLIAVYTAQHNAMPNEGTSYKSPLDVLKYYVDNQSQHFLIRKMPVKAGSPAGLIPLILNCMVRGGQSSGRRPYVQIDGVRYTNPVLARSSGLIGQKLSIRIDEEDMRFCEAYLADGRELGILKASGRWGETKHSRKTRKIILSLITRKIIAVTSQVDPIQVYLDYLSQSNKGRSRNKKLLNPRHATEASRVAKESGLPKRIIPRVAISTAPEISLTQLQQSRPTLMSDPMPDLNQLLKQKNKRL